MNCKQVMTELKSLGTAQNVKVYQRHGAGDKLFGVSFANLGKLKKKIGRDQKLAEQLWKSQNTDAQTLALMVADPGVVSAGVIDGWMKDIRYGLLAGSLAEFVAQTRFAASRLKKWTKSKREFVRSAGFSLVCALTKSNDASAAEILSDDVCRDLLATIEAEIHESKNHARQSMNAAVISIGIYRRKLTALAKSTAKRIGPVMVDHGETSCKTPDAIAYIDKALKRKKS